MDRLINILCIWYVVLCILVLSRNKWNEMNEEKVHVGLNIFGLCAISMFVWLIFLLFQETFPVIHRHPWSFYMLIYYFWSLPIEVHLYFVLILYLVFIWAWNSLFALYFQEKLFLVAQQHTLLKLHEYLCWGWYPW